MVMGFEFDGHMGMAGVAGISDPSTAFELERKNWRRAREDWTWVADDAGTGRRAVDAISTPLSLSLSPRRSLVPVAA